MLVSLYMRLTALPTEASLLRPTELGWPPGIQALLFISGLRALFFVIGDIEPCELFGGATECWRCGMLYLGTRVARVAGFGFGFGTSRCCAFSMSLRAFEFR